MKKTRAIYVMTLYGKRQTYVCSNWVLEKSFKDYEKEEITRLRGYGWNEEIQFISPMSPTVVNTEIEDGTGCLRVWTNSGFKLVATVH